MSIRFIIILSLSVCCTYATAQPAMALMDAPYTKIGMYQSHPEQALLSAANQALLPKYKQFTATAFGEQRFMLEDLSFMQLGLVLPFSSGAFAVQAASFGSAAFRQSKVGLGYGRSLSEQLTIGTQFNFLHYSIAGYGQASTVTTAVGILLQCSPTVTAGLHVDNLTGSALPQWKGEQTPQVFSAGLGYAPSSAFMLEATLVKERTQPLNLLTSLQYTVQQKLVVKGGLSTATSLFYFGTGYKLGALQLEALASWHPYLGISPGLMLTYKKENE